MILGITLPFYLVLALESSPEALGVMLATIERKGRVRKIEGGPGCATSCCKCDPATVAVYEWAGNPRCW